MDSFRKKQQHNCDVGGMGCRCCNKFHGKDKYKLNKQARKQLKEEDHKNFQLLLTPKTREEIIDEIVNEDITVFWKERCKEIYQEYVWWM